MSHRKQPSKRKLAAALGAAGLSLSLAGGISAASAAPTADMPTRNTGASHEITLCEEEVSDVSLATFHVFNAENPGTFRRRIKLAQGCGGCGCGFGCGGGGEQMLLQRGLPRATAMYRHRRTQIGERLRHRIDVPNGALRRAVRPSTDPS
jgi:hypothetical protein